MTEEFARALLTVADIPVEAMYRLENQYWPDAYGELRARHPWWLAKTPFGLIKFGLRKRVYSIEWEDTKVEIEATKDDVTKDKFLVHAWGIPKMVEYMINIRVALVAAQEKKQLEAIK